MVTFLTLMMSISHDESVQINGEQNLQVNY